MGAPARQALENNKINTLSQLAEFTEADVLKWHGMGKSSLFKSREALSLEGLTFEEDQVKANVKNTE